MEVSQLYYLLKDSGIDAQNFHDFTQGYAFYLSSFQNDWTATHYPCRIVYKCRNSAQMVVLPLYLPDFESLIWGIELNGVYFYKSYKEVYGQKKEVKAALKKLSNRIMGKQGTKIRPLQMPTIKNLKMLYNYSGAVYNLAGSLHGTKGFCKFFGYRQWAIIQPTKDLVITDESYSKFNVFHLPKKENCVALRPVLKADKNLDCFCSVNKFGVPDWDALHKCIMRLAE